MKNMLLGDNNIFKGPFQHALGQNIPLLEDMIAQFTLLNRIVQHYSNKYHLDVGSNKRAP